MTAGFIAIIVWTVVRNYVLPWLVDRLRKPAPVQAQQRFIAQGPHLGDPSAAQPPNAPPAAPAIFQVPHEDLAHEVTLSIPFTITITPRPPV